MVMEFLTECKNRGLPRRDTQGEKVYSILDKIWSALQYSDKVAASAILALNKLPIEQTFG